MSHLTEQHLFFSLPALGLWPWLRVHCPSMACQKLCTVGPILRGRCWQHRTGKSQLFCHTYLYKLNTFIVFNELYVTIMCILNHFIKEPHISRFVLVLCSRLSGTLKFLWCIIVTCKDFFFLWVFLTMLVIYKSGSAA